MSKTDILLESGTNEFEVVEFFIDEHDPETDRTSRTYYGMNVAKVLEIIRLPELTDMPDASNPSVMGAFDLRTEIVPLIDLSHWVGKKLQQTEHLKVIVTEFNQVITSFLVSGVTRIYRLSWDQVKAPNVQLSSLTSNSITGIVRLEGKIVFLLDLEKIVAKLNELATPNANVSSEVKKELESKNYKAIIADDSTMVRNMVFNMLSENNFEVAQFENGKEAWVYLENLKNESPSSIPDIAILDIEMPLMDGHHLTKRIKDDPVLKKIPILLCSSIITESLYHKGVEVGADAQISKAKINELVEKAFQLIKKKSA
ncbi:MAG: chemotaxis protein CheV [Desulfovibrio sp.]|nr:chemotaxis protein CheV [Desulfovibrio sp.]MBI4961372.1 chemotaxis protein CheV [Desulfovibrio sp.]